MKILAIALVAWMTVASAHAQNAEEATGIIGVTVQGSFNFGPVDGFLQTPSGGRPGTSSAHRPKLDELGIDDVAFYDAGLDVQWKQLRAYGGYQFIRLDGSETLSQPLISHGVGFAAGDAVRTHDRLDWSRVGGGWSFDFLEHRLEVIPKAELALMDFKYHLAGATESADRSYIKGTVRLGAESTYHLNRILSFSLDGAASIPLSNTPQIATVIGTTALRLLPESRRIVPRIFAGAGMEWIEYEDNQKLSNHIKADLGPFLMAGVNVSF